MGAHASGEIGEDPQGIPNNLMPYVCQVAVGKLKELSIYGNDYATPDGTGVRDYIHVVDLALGHVAALKGLAAMQEPGPGRTSGEGVLTFNLGTGRGYSVLDVVQAFERASGRKVPYRIVARRPGDVGSSYGDPTLAKTLLGWKAERGIDDICRDAWRWQQANPAGYRA